MAEFNSTLDEATSYTLVVDLKQGLFFAFSNIFYDGTTLTFDKTEAMASDVYSCNYQGVCFKWGSLIGISPLGNGDASVLYIPNTGNKTWDNTKTIATSSFGNWGGIPCTTTNTGLSSPNDKGEDYLHNNPQFSQYRGDICNYIDADWRLPNAGEFATQVSGLVGNGYYPGGITSSNAAGTGKLSGVHRKQISGGTVIPGWGYISDGALVWQDPYSGHIGFYWTGSGGAYLYSYRGVQNESAVGGASRELGCAVRCIKK
jgi:hypothetical protein